jgi:beta-N-acetylhexosaminidase
MMKKMIIVILACLLIFLLGCRGRDIDIPDPNDEKNSEHVEKPDEIAEKIKSMTIEEKIGQLVMIGIEGEKADENIKEMIESRHAGGIILFSGNIKSADQTLELLNNLKDLNRGNIPLFLGLDEEGGRVTRLSKEFVKIPSMEEVGNKNDKDYSFRIGEALGTRVKGLGFNIDFAPVMDINSNYKNPVIGDRSFGDNPKIVIEQGAQVMSGIKSTGVISVVKHFPGHGDTKVDSHKKLPVVDKTFEEIDNFELLPFKKSIEEGVDGIMIAHILFPKIDGENPASFSYTIINDILREKLNYRGVIITDDMTMGAVMNNYDIGEASVKSLKAGSDIILVCHGYENEHKVLDTIKEAVESGDIKEEDIDKKLYRILKLKEKYVNDERINEVNIEDINRKTRDILSYDR